MGYKKILQWTSLLVAFSMLSLNSFAQGPDVEAEAKELHEARVFAEKFWAELVEKKDIRPLLDKYAVKNFARCIQPGDLAFFDGISTRSSLALYRYYRAETNFLLLSMLWGGSAVEADKVSDKEDEDGDAFEYDVFPEKVKRFVSRKTWERTVQSMDFDWKQPKSDKRRKNELRFALNTIEKVNLALREENIRIGAGKNELFKTNMRRSFENDEYQFKPELGEKAICGSRTSRRIIYVDVPLFQLALVKENGKLKVAQFPFHVD